MFLFILESIGTSELILIGIIALIFLGPRKLPQIARTIGKTMADFRSTTNEFKSTWEREVNFEDETRALRTGELPASGPEPVPRTTPQTQVIESNPDTNSNTLAMPEIRPAEPNLFAESARGEEDATTEEANQTIGENYDDTSDKKNWL